MKRNIYQQLKIWKNKENHKPLLIFGQRQVGKTYIIRQFGKKEYKNFIEINLMENERIKKLIETYSDIKELIITILNMYNLSFNELNETLIFFDEIQESNRALISLKLINESDINANIICTGSYLGYLVKKDFSFPIGNVELIYMKQMMFDEFLEAIDKKHILNNAILSLKENKNIDDFTHEILIEYFNKYLIIGGFPEVVKTYITNNFVAQEALAILKNIYNGYLYDIDKYSTIFKDKTFLRIIFKNINKFLINENKKFKFNEIDQNAKYRELEKYIIWLDNSNLVYKVNNIKNITSPLIDKEVFNNFKLYFNDHSFVTLSKNLFQIDDKDLYNKVKGGLCENFVFSQIKYDFEKYYFYKYLHNGKNYEVDLVVEDNKYNPCAIEIKSGTNFKLKGLRYINSDIKKFVLSLSNYYEKENYINIPIYLSFMLKDIINDD